jgi:hypothetical protein
MTICTPWRPAAACGVLKEQVDALYPVRRKGSDGTIGDAAHQAEACSSQHNSCCVKRNGVWIIRAIDITHDPAHGCDIQQLFDRIRASRDPRVRYLIFNRRICYPTARNGYPAWAWQPYNGDNPHTEHGHLSVTDDPAQYDNTRAWAIGGSTPAGVHPAVQEEIVDLVRNPTGGIFKGTNRGKVGLTWDEYVSLGQPRFIQAGSDARVDELLPAPLALDPEAIAREVAAAVVAAPDNPATEADAEAIAAAVLAKLRAALGGAA